MSAARAGAREAAAAFSKEWGVRVRLRDLTPRQATAKAQADALGQLFVDQADAVLLYPLDLETTRPFAGLMAKRDVPILLFGFTRVEPPYYAAVTSSHAELARRAVEEAAALARERRGTRKLALLATSAENHAQAERLTAATEALANADDLELEQVVRSEPDLGPALAAMKQALAGNGSIEGWIMLGDWALLGMAALPWEADGGQLAVAIGALPPALRFVGNGQVQALVAPHYHNWGHRSMQMALLKIHLGRDPGEPNTPADTLTITPLNLEEARDRWAGWMTE